MAKRRRNMMTHMIRLKLNHMSHPMKMIVMNLTILTMNCCLRRFSGGQIHLSLKKKEVTVGSLTNEEDHFATGWKIQFKNTCSLRKPCSLSYAITAVINNFLTYSVVYI